ncbi:ISAs1 family transposase [Erysipelotrichaceae bacterium HCN-30851]
MKKGNKAVESLVEILSKIPDPRDNRGKKHSLVKILLLTIIGFLIGKTDFTNMVHCLKKQENELKKYMDLENGIPSHDTFSRIMRKLDNMQMIYAICNWFGSLTNINGKQLIIDGKGILAAAEKNKYEKTPYIVNVIEEASKMVLMQLKIDNKENEMTGILKVLDYIDIKDTVITIDAIGMQRPIIKKIKKEERSFCTTNKREQRKIIRRNKVIFR